MVLGLGIRNEQTEIRSELVFSEKRPLFMGDFVANQESLARSFKKIAPNKFKQTHRCLGYATSHEAAAMRLTWK